MNKHVIGLATAPLIVAGMAGAIVSPVFADEARMGYSGPCAGLQDAINSAIDNTPFSVSVTGDCAANITIPSGKRILLDFNGGILGDEYGDTITVENGAFACLVNGTLVNSASDKAIVKNDGLTVIYTNLTANDGAYSIINTGEVNIVNTTATGFKVNNSGVLRIAYGTIDNAEEAEPYVTGAINTDVGSDGQPDFTIPRTIPVGYKTTLQYRNPALAATLGETLESDNNSILSIAGSALSGYSLEAKSAGNAEVSVHNWISAGGGLALVYNIESNTPGLINGAVLDYLVGRYGYEIGDQENSLEQALANNESISVDLNIDEVDAEDIDEEDVAKIHEALGNGKVLAYGDISLAINASESGLIEEITLLGGCGSTGEPGAEPVCVENPINVKWGGLDLGSPADGYKRNFYVIRLHDGEATKIAANIDKDGNLVFSSGKFSTYAVAYEDVEITAEDTTEEADTTAGAPNTGAETQAGKNTVLSLMGCMAAGIVLALTMLPKIRKYLEARKA